ncbi:MAG: ATP-binding cassette domain-containing protein [Chloroflexi bacterium]|nr:ATP-binding cassette domain-containing protein [Chloroflexota bacterium]
MEADVLLRAENLEKHFPVTEGLVLMRTVGRVRAVDGISFEVRRGRTLALVGESGCGKTTTAKLVLRLETPTGGTISMEGQDIHALSGQGLRRFRTQVQAVFQDPWSSLSPRMRVAEIVAEPLVVNKNVSRGEARQRVLELLNDVGLRPEQADLFPHEFSGGQRQRIAMASALSVAPALIVLDEPVSALDVSVQAQIMNLLRDLQAQHDVSYLMVSHNLATVRYLAHEVAVMYLGEIVERAETDDLYEHPLHPYTQALFSSALPAHPAQQRDEVMIQGEPPSPLDPPSGCRFHPRCPFAKAVCAEVAPEWKEETPGHFVACHLY